MEIIFIEKCLKKYDYPNLYGADLPEILGGPNRIFLLSWLYKLILDEDSSLTSNEPTVEVLTDFINSFGFCATSQTKQFIEMSLDYSIQIQILYRMFKMLNVIQCKYKYPENSDELPHEVIDSFSKRDINIFKSFGNIKISENCVDIDSPNDSMKVESEEHDEFKKLSLMEKEIDCASGVIDDLLKHSGTINNLDLPIIEGEIEDLKVFNESVTKAKEIIENIQTISVLKDGISYDKITTPEANEYVEMTKEIIKLINGI